MTTFQIDTEYARTLARDLHEAAAGSPVVPPTFPSDLSEFGSLVTAAVSNLDARTQQLRADARAMAEASLIMADDADSADSALGAELSTTAGGL